MISLPPIPSDSEDESDEIIPSRSMCYLGVLPHKSDDPAPPRPNPVVPLPSMIVNFYSDTSPDVHGRTLNEILRLNAQELRMLSHWKSLFPVPEEDYWVRIYPIVNKEVFDAFVNSAQLRERLHDAFKKALWFFGFYIVDDSDQKHKVSWRKASRTN
jgi:hypothetical protein